MKLKMNKIQSIMKEKNKREKKDINHKKKK